MTQLATPPPGLVVVKVGGSLYDHPRLGPGLRAYLDRIDAPCVLIVAGGGLIADAVRALDTWHDLDEEKSHWFAMLATHFTMHIVRELTGVERWTAWLEWWVPSPGVRVKLLSCMGFLQDYERLFGPVPHTWDLTTDSIAAYAAAVGRAKLILLKSIDVPAGTPWEQAAARGWVDGQFPHVVATHGLDVEVMNFRQWLDGTGY